MPRRVLVIDDEEDIRTVTALSLQSMAGWEVTAASSGEEGVARAESFQPDAILLDVMMPGMDGPATMRALRGNPRTVRIPVLMLTAKAQGGDTKRLRELGVKAVLLKPFDPLTLSSQIAAILGWN